MIRASWHPLAKRELFEGADFYEDRAEGLDEAFLATVENAVVRIRRHPRSGPLILGSIRCLRIRPFPYGIIYRIEEDRIFILAIAHDKRRPRYWARRM